jgi:hypothetical protein
MEPTRVPSHAAHRWCSAERLVMALYWVIMGLAVVTGLLWAIADQKKAGS